jgi:hypothetical protein
MAKRAQRQRAQKLQTSLLEYLDRSAAGADTGAFLAALQQWLASNLHAFEEQERAAYRLDELAAMSIAALPTIYADFEPAVECTRLRDVAPSSIGYLAMAIRDLFREGTTVWSNRECPACGGLLRVLQAEGNPDCLGYECDVCTWAEREDGTEWTLDAKLVPATTVALRRHGRLPRSARE